MQAGEAQARVPACCKSLIAGLYMLHALAALRSATASSTRCLQNNTKALCSHPTEAQPRTSAARCASSTSAARRSSRACHSVSSRSRSAIWRTASALNCAFPVSRLSSWADSSSARSCSSMQGSSVRRVGVATWSMEKDR